MALRVTQGLMYSGFIQGMNGTLSAYMESNMQSASQKKVNRPSDSPVDAGRILSTRASIDNMSAYEDNINMAKGWLNLADNIVGSGNGSIQTVLTRIKELAVEAADGSKTAENRQQISYEVRELFGQLINLGNQTFNGSHIFAGHKTADPPYAMGLGTSIVDDTDYTASGGDPLSAANITVTGGDTSKTVLIQPMASGAVEAVEYRYTTDGGKTWYSAGQPNVDTTKHPHMATLNAGGALVQIPITDNDGNPKSYMVTGVPPDESGNPVGAMLDGPEDLNATDNGTWMYLRPTAIYQGDDASTEVTTPYRPAGSSLLKADAEGHFARDIIVRLDSINPGPPQTIGYSYSADDGSNWVQTTAPDTSATGSMTLPVPGGYLTVSDTAALSNAEMGTQFVIHPHRADIDFKVGDNDSITVNMIGMDIFGGMYDKPEDGIDYPTVVGDPSSNLFEVVGNLIAALETNSQSGVQASLPEIENVMKVVLTRAAEIGGRQNRLETSYEALISRSYAEQDNLSAMEDADVSTLMTKLAQQQIAYNSVLKSSSMIMQMSLMNFL